MKYYNDSIGTSPSRTVACLESFPEPVILIAGGYDKGIPFHALALEIRERVKTLVLTGDTARAIRQAVEEAEGGRGCPEIIQTEDLAGAVEAARRAAGPGTWWCCPPPARPSTASRTSWSGAGRSRSWSGPCDRKHKGGTLSWIMMRYFPACAAWAPQRIRGAGVPGGGGAAPPSGGRGDRGPDGQRAGPAPVRQGGGEAAAAGRPSGRDRLCGHRP